MKIHLVGIGGIGISAIAKFLKFKGHSVTGSDISDTYITKELQNSGIEVNVPHKASCVKGKDLVIYSSAIKSDNVELARAKELNIKTINRGESLDLILKDKTVFSVCGSHGKSTTTAMIASLIDCSCLIGAQTKEFNSNTKFSNCNNIIFEADESDESFLNSNPHCAIVTNVEPEHMEYYNYDLDRFYGAYEKFLNIAKRRVINAEDEFLSTLSYLDATRLYPSKDIKDIEYILIHDEPYTKFKLKNFGEFCVWGLGEHIAVDASLAVLTAMDYMSLDYIKSNIARFKGIKKRFDVVNKSNSVIIDDYGHHPTEIKATMNSLKTYKKLKGIDKLVTIWQPHKYSRTLDNLEGFRDCFKGSEKLVILPVWGAGESEVNIDFKKEFSSYDVLLADKIERDNHKVNALKGEEVLESFNDDLIVGFGAGDITYQIRGA